MLKSIVALALAALASTADAAPITVGLGEEIYHDEQGENLIGNGRQTRSVIVRYLGLTAPGRLRFERTDRRTEDVSNIHNAAPPVTSAPVTTQIAVELAKDPDLRIGARTLHILSATQSGVTYEEGR